MCGIVGVLGKGPVAGQLVDALKRLEYRGYDSAGVATVENGMLGRRRAEGKLRNLEARLQSSPLLGDVGIGHTRWATHGKPTEANAHPHMTDDVSVVHNGIIENYRELKNELVAEGAAFSSDTDTEVIAHMITRELRAGNDPVRAVFHTLKRLEGAFALAMIFRGYNDLMIAAREGSPLAIGYGDGEMYLGSDAIALGPFTDTIAYLEDGDWVVLTRNGATIYDKTDAVVHRDPDRWSSTWAADATWELGKGRRVEGREAILALTRPELEAISSSDSADRFLRLRDRLEEAVQAARDSRQSVVGSFDVLITATSQRTNEIMKVLTLASVLLLPGALIAGVMGMNFRVGLFEHTSLFWVTVAVIFGIALVTLVTARVRHWI